MFFATPLLRGVTLACLGVMCLGLYTEARAEEAHPEVAVLYIPHPDDEIISFGAWILYALSEDIDVHVVFLTRGGASIAIHPVNNRLEAMGRDPIDVEEFMQGRIREATLSMLRIGVPEKNLHVLDLPDGAVTPEQVEAVIRDFEARFPGASHRSTSYHDRHTDHRAAGEALLRLYDAGEVSHARFHVPLYHWDDPIPGDLAPWSEAWEARYHEGLNAFRLWLPEEGYYSVGYKSTKDSIDTRYEEPRSKIHLPHEEVR